MSLNWSSIGSTLSGVTSTLSSLGITGTNAQSILAQIGLASNPNQSAELAICSQLLQFAAQPALENELALKLATEQGIPADAATLAMTLTQPGVDITARVLEIEQLIKQGG